LEAQKVCGGHESRLSSLLDEAVDVLRRRVAAAAGDGRIGGPLTASAPVVEVLRALEVIGFVLPAVRLTDLDAIDLHRAADEEAVPDVPIVLPPLAPDRHLVRAVQLELLALVQDVLLQLLPVVVALREHVAHEG